MKTLIGMLMMLVVMAAAAPAADVTGKWAGSFTIAGGETNSAFVILKQTGTTVTGSGGPDEGQQWPMTKGKIEGNKITGEVTNPNGIVYKLSLTVVSADQIKGDVEATNPEGQPMKATMDLKKAK